MQNGTPTPENPVEMQSVGDLVTQGEYANKYKLPVTAIKGEETFIANIYLDEPLRKVGDIVDYIDFIEGKRINNTGIALVDGTTDCGVISYWSYGTKQNSLAAGVRLLGKKTNKTNLYALSDSFITYKTGSWTPFYGGSTPDIYVGHMCADASGTGCYLAIPKEYDTTQKIKDYFASHPAQIIYELETPTEEPIEIPTELTAPDTYIISVGTTVQPSAMN